MKKFGFDFLLEQSEIITEMAKLSQIARMSQDNSQYSAFKDIYGEVVKKMQTEGKIPTANARNKTFSYLISVLADDVYSSEQARFMANTMVKSDGEFLPQFVNWLGKLKWSPEKELEYTMIELVKKNVKKTNSSEFKKMALDTNHIVEFATNNRIPNHSNFASGISKRKEKLHKLPLERIHEIDTLAKPLVITINKLIRKMKGKGYTDTETDVSDDDAIIQGPDYWYNEDLLSELSMIGLYQTDKVDDDTETGIWAKKEVTEKPKNDGEWRKFFAKNISKNDYAVIEDFLTKRLDTGGINQETMTKVSANLGKKDPNLQKLGNFLMGQIDKKDPSTSGTSGDYKEYDQNIIDKVLNTDEKRDIFADWYSLQSERNNADISRETNKAVRSLKSIDNGDKNNSNNDIDKQILDLMDKAVNSDSPEAVRSIKLKIDKLRQSQNSTEEDEENLMGYMAEQIKSDSHFHIIGEYKDRGFKKITNYNHWLSVNS